MPRLLLLLTLSICYTSATPLKIVTIGDSLTDGYSEVARLAEVPLLGAVVGDRVYPEPDSPNPDGNVRAFNWPELLAIFRPNEADFGPTGEWGDIDDTFFFPLPSGDLRFRGFQKNFAVVGTTTLNWTSLLTSNPVDDGSFPLNLFYDATKSSLLTQLATADVVVIMLGGNDLKNAYSDIFNAADPSPFLDPVRTRLETIHAAVRAENASVPIVVATVPDVGATPNIYQIYNTPALQATTRAHIAAMNQAIITTFEAKPNTSVARVDRLTDLAFDLDPFHLNGTEFTIEGDPYNPPDHLFCKDNFHPGTAAQALIANEIMLAINTRIPGAMTPFSHREILGSVLALDPDQPFIDWAAAYSLAPDSFDLDSDGDGLPNGVEMLFGTSPVTSTNSPTGRWEPGGGLTWNINEDASRYIQWSAEESPDLDSWTDVPMSRLILTGGTATATPPALERSFFRIQANPAP
ncbi:SGNH/GDSL hydrolase family protein [Haloferula rosea]|uniref:SGNH hydrolase-type esterase domain-containing protein n=1 Tax=Haloferula rosea TaxID=490093 RepID=A0A934VEN6_9BACT|nr:SGNH/GDSL hydrolase family protein [Haloferula rosea]MBK1826142.1 hypothetical protein [Haloferula rosea]